MVELKADFSGSIPAWYDRCLGPAWFDHYAALLASRLPADPGGDVLEAACGTGLLTRHLRRRLDPARRLVATDLSPAMTAHAREHVALPGIGWGEADLCRLPFTDGAFAAAACAFGLMFVPDKAAAFAELRRVLAPGGLLLFTVWDRAEANPHTLVHAAVVEVLFPGDEGMRFGVPYEMHDRSRLQHWLQGAGFALQAMEVSPHTVGGIGAHELASGILRGTPRSSLIVQRGVPLETVIERSAAALAAVGGDPYRGPVQAIVVEARAQ